MTTVSSTNTLAGHFPTGWSIADLQDHLGGIPAERIRLVPPPGSATEDDVDEIDIHEDRLFELIDGVLVEKTVGWYESQLAVLIATQLSVFVREHDLGKVLGADGTLKILPGMVRIPDACFISWDRFPKEKVPRRPIPALIPDLAVEVLSASNTPREMDDKLKHYFEAGVRLVWYVDAEKRTAKSYTAPDEMEEVAEDGQLDGGNVLPGFQLSLQELFEEADRQGPA